MLITSGLLKRKRLVISTNRFRAPYQRAAVANRSLARIDLEVSIIVAVGLLQCIGTYDRFIFCGILRVLAPLADGRHLHSETPDRRHRCCFTNGMK